MIMLLAAINSSLLPYWDTYKKRLSQEGLASLTILHSPNIVGHTVGIVVLVWLGLFAIPSDPKFFLFWFAMVGVAAVQLTLVIWGLVRSNFFGVQLINNLGFVAASVGAVIFIGEQLNFIQYLALLIAVVGVAFFVWPKSKIIFSQIDKGIAFVVAAVALNGVTSVLYKIATFHAPDYATFLTGRFFGDLIAWSIVWFVTLVWMGRSPFGELARCIREQNGRIMIAGFAGANLLGSWLIYQLPVTKLAIIGTLGIPASYFLSSYKYREHLTMRMCLGTICIILSIGIFLFYGV